MQLFDQLTAAQASSLHHWDGGRFERRTWAEMLAEARRMAAGLRDAGVRPGVVLATVLTNSYESVAGLMGAWLAGGAVASLPIPARGMSIEDYAAQLGQLCEQVQSPMLVLDEKLLRAVPESLGQQVPIRSWESLPRDATIELTPPEEDDLAFVQYSSGSTRMPKGCMLTARAIGNQLDIVADMVSAVPGDERVVSWLPLSHDMGVFGCLLYSWAWDFELALSTPMRFVYDPLSWFADLSDFRGTLSAGTPSALHVAVRAHRGSGFDGDLAALRACVIGAERVSIQTLDAASDAFAACGLSRAAWLPAYGLAEATLVVSTIGLDEEPVSIDVDRNALTEGEIREASPAVTAATSLVSMGRACDGVEVRLEDPGRLSEILVRSKSLAGGYFGQPELTAERFGDGELRTGDLGFERDGELYVVGRSDDLLSVAGRNVYARGIEEAVDMLEPVRSGCSTIVDVGEDGRARLVMLLELADDHADTRNVAREVSRMAKSKAGVVLDECMFLARGTLPKTPSGKIQRFRCRQLVASELLEPVARVALRPRRAGIVEQSERAAAAVRAQG